MMIFRSIIVFAIIADITCIIVRPSGTEESKDTSRRAKPKDASSHIDAGSGVDEGRGVKVYASGSSYHGFMLLRTPPL